MYLPASSPDFNPVERLLLIQAEWFCDFAARDREALVARLDQTLNWAMPHQNGNQPTCSNPMRPGWGSGKRPVY